MIHFNHKWAETERFYSDPYPGEMKVKGMDQDLFRKISIGVTTILYQCSVCKKPKIVEIYGKGVST